MTSGRRGPNVCANPFRGPTIVPCRLACQAWASEGRSAESSDDLFGAGPPLPDLSSGEGVGGQGAWKHLRAIAGQARRLVSAAEHAHRLDEMLVQVLGVLTDPTFEGSANGDVIEDRDVLDVLT